MHTHTHTHTHTVGSMLAHLHTLESENRQMQSKIMELASQREFYIAINTKLRQSLAEQDSSNHLPNGIRSEPQLMSHDMHMTSGPRHRASSKRNGNMKQHRYQIDNIETHRTVSNEVIVPSMLSKDAQDSLLKAHFQATTTGLFLDQRSDPAHHRGHSKPAYSHAPIEGNERKITHPSKGSPRRSYQVKGLAEQTENAHEITCVTNSVQAPISAFTPLPGDGCQDDRTVDNVS